MALTCPRCSQNLQARKEGTVEVDACPDCRGVWLDFGEIEQLVEDKDVLVKVFQGDLVNPAPSTCSCPKCGVALKLLKGGLVSPVLIVDKCPKCLGLWLDDGELRLLKKILTTATTSPS